MEVDDKLLQRINRQLRAIKIMLAIFFVMIVGMLVLLGFITYKVVTFTHEVNNKVSNIEKTTSQKLDIKGQLCDQATGYIAQQFCQ